MRLIAIYFFRASLIENATSIYSYMEIPV